MLTTQRYIKEYPTDDNDVSQDDSKDHFLVAKTEYQSPSLKSALAVFTNLYSSLKKREEGEGDVSYDGDADGEVPAPVEEKKKRKKVSKKKSPLAIKLRGDEQGAKADKLQFLVRDVIFYIGKEDKIRIAQQKH